MNITEEFGKMGKEESRIFFNISNPFKTLKDLKSLINGNTNSRMHRFLSSKIESLRKFIIFVI